MFCSLFVVVLYPLYESRMALAQILGGIIKVSCLYIHLDPVTHAVIGCVHQREWKICCAHEDLGLTSLVAYRYTMACILNVFIDPGGGSVMS